MTTRRRPKPRRRSRFGCGRGRAASDEGRAGGVRRRHRLSGRCREASKTTGKRRKWWPNHQLFATFVLGAYNFGIALMPTGHVANPSQGDGTHMSAAKSLSTDAHPAALTDATQVDFDLDF